jgi:hypothetical protein
MHPQPRILLPLSLEPEDVLMATAIGSHSSARYFLRVLVANQP